MADVEYTFRIMEAAWDFGDGVGTQNVICYHQYIDADGVPVEPDGGGGSWEPFIPGPTIRGSVGQTVQVTIQNRMSDPDDHFIHELKMETTIHWHGIELANVHDGTPVTQKPITTGNDFVYKFELIRPGMFWYHSHWDSMIQNQYGGHGPIIVENAITDELRTEKIIPHQDRTYEVTLSDTSFQKGGGVESSANWLSVEADEIEGDADPRIRNIHAIAGAAAQNMGDVYLINGIYNIPFNHPDGNFRQFWPNGERLTAGEITVNEDESIALYILNAGMHRFYKVHLAYRTVVDGPWTRSDNLFRLGGEGGLLERARAGGGVFDDGTNVGYYVRGHAERGSGAGDDTAGEGLNDAQTATQFTAGEFLLSASSRMLVAFAVEEGWVEVAIRVNGFSVGGSGGADELPEDMIIAQFPVSTTVDDTYKLDPPIDATTDLITNAALATPDSLEDLRDADVIVDEFACDYATLLANGVPVPASGSILTDYDIKLQQLGGGAGPAIDGAQPIWGPEGPEQETADNTRYVTKDDVVQWMVEVENPNTDHPWHKHGFSFQPIRIEVNDGAGNYTLLYEWDFVEYVDVIYVPYSHRITYLFKVEDRNYIGEDDSVSTDGVLGRWLAHCHIFKHAHNGMMMNFIAVDDCLMPWQHVDVYMRDNTADDGSEPSSDPISASPDIILLPDEVVGTPDDNFGDGSGTENDSSLGYEATGGQDNYLYARVNNRGTQPALVKVDIYWSEVSTLVTPSTWTFIGETTEMTVEPGVLKVSDAVTWEAADIPGDGHYCFIGIVGSQTDTKTLTQDGVDTYEDFTDWNDWKDFVKAYNNVTWRNFNVVDTPEEADDSDAAEKSKSGEFKFRGAWDKDRPFDLEFLNPFEQVQLVVPNDQQIRDRLNTNVAGFAEKGNELFIDLLPRTNLRLANLLLEQNKDYKSRFIIRDANEAVYDRQFGVVQYDINDYVNELAQIADEIRVTEARLEQAKQQGNDERARKLAEKLESLQGKKRDYERLASNPEQAERTEVGRVTWLYVRDRNVAAPDDPADDDPVEDDNNGDDDPGGFNWILWLIILIILALLIWLILYLT